LTIEPKCQIFVWERSQYNTRIFFCQLPFLDYCRFLTR